MIRSVEALRINLVDILSPRRTRREPSVLGQDLKPANGRPVAGRAGEDRLDFPSGQIFRPDLLRREFPQNLFLLRRSRCLHAVVSGLAELVREFAVDLPGIAVHPRGDLRRKQSGDDSVFVRRPHAAIQTDERGTRALFAAEAQ